MLVGCLLPQHPSWKPDHGQGLGTSEVTVFEVVEEGGPLGGVTGECGSGGCFAVAGEDTPGRVGDFDAVTLHSAAAGFTPLDRRRAHNCSLPLVICCDGGEELLRMGRI